MTEWRYLTRFAEHLRRCDVTADESVVVLSESTSRPVLVETARLAAQSIGAKTIDVIVPTPAATQPVPIRSTGASHAIAWHPAALGALCAANVVIDCTVEGLLHSPELGTVLAAGSRVLMISNEHPDVFDRVRWDPQLPVSATRHERALRDASRMTVTSAHGTDLTVQLAGAFCASSTGLTNGPGTIAHWPGGLVLAFPAATTVNGTVVLAPGDINLTFNRYVASPVTLTVVDDYIVDVAGDGVDALLFRGYLDAFGDRECYATSHVGWGLNRAARWESMACMAHGDVWGTEARAIAGNFLYSCGANEVAKRFTAGHFDLPMRNCTIRVDSTDVVVDGVLQDL